MLAVCAPSRCYFKDPEDPVKGEADHRHPEPAELDMGIWKRGDFTNPVTPPRGQDSNRWSPYERRGYQETPSNFSLFARGIATPWLRGTS